MSATGTGSDVVRDEREEPLEILLGHCPPDGAAAHIEVLIRAALNSWQAIPRDTRGALQHLGNAMALIARRDDL
jgi:hypothetical protein